jgi:CHAT domain-containing protein/tetratricopeptide (TPR) repeat protein
MGDRQEGSLHLRRGLDIAQATLAPCNPERVGLEDLAATYLMRDGQFIAAREQYEQALAACRRCLGDTHSITASVMFNLAELTANIGDFADAERLYNTVISVWSSQRRDHPYVARALDALAQVVEARGDPQRARALYERALVIRRRVRPDHPDVAWTLTNLARVTADAGSPVLALRYLEQALEIYERVGTADVPDHLERALELRGEILGRRHDYAGALTNFSEALDNRERFFGASHPLAAQTRSRLAWAEWGLGSSEEALRLSLSAEEAGRAHFRDTARYLPEREALAYAATRPNGLSLALSIAVAGDTANGAVVMDSEIRSRSMVLDELGARTKSANNPDPAITMLEADLAVKRQRFANLMLQSMAGDASPALTAMLRDATQQKEAAERALASQSAAFRSELDRSGIGFNEVTRALPPGTALVSYVRYERSVAQTSSRAAGSSPDQIPNSRILQSVPSYVAFVLRSDSPDPWVLPLGSASAIEALIRGWRAEIVERHTLPPEQSGASTLGGQLRRRIWDPAAAHLADIKEVFIVPDGDINLIPFAALPVARGGYLLEHGPLLHYLSAERDLVSLSDTSGLRGSGLLAIGGPAFSNPSSFTARPKNGVAANSARNDVRGACGDLGTLRFADLPASMFEAESVLSLSRQSRIGDGTGDDRLLSGADATEAAFKAFGPGHRIVHLATHGFVLGADCVATVAGLRGVGGLTPVGVARAANTGRPARRAEPGNPLLLSGLAFAGANERRTTGPDADDGILTAEEVAGMNLSGVEWAVLSACDTGLGEIRAGEGVFGLRRAFQVAGVRTVIMSLWPVEDVATRQWMEALYRARLGDRLDTAEAVRQASLTLIRERRARGQSTDLFYWAAFVAAGDWR